MNPVSSQNENENETKVSSTNSNEAETSSTSSGTQLMPSKSSTSSVFEAKKESVMVKVGMIGDSQTGKTSLMVKYVEGRFDDVHRE